MIKMTLGQAGAFNSPLINKLFQDEKRAFPPKDAFRLSVAVKDITKYLEPYGEQLKKIVAEKGGTIHENGMISYTTPEKQAEAVKIINELNSEEIKIDSELLSITDSWPNLSLSEITILSPLIKQE